MPAGNYDPSFNMIQIMPVVDGTVGPDQLNNPGRRTLLVDYLDQGWQRIMDGITSWDDCVWRGEKITTLCHRYHGTTSTWLLTLSFNGLSAPWELRPGMSLRIPRLPNLSRSTQSAKISSSGIGRFVTV